MKKEPRRKNITCRNELQFAIHLGYNDLFDAKSSVSMSSRQWKPSDKHHQTSDSQRKQDSGNQLPRQTSDSQRKQDSGNQLPCQTSDSQCKQDSGNSCHAKHQIANVNKTVETSRHAKHQIANVNKTVETSRHAKHQIANVNKTAETSHLLTDNFNRSCSSSCVLCSPVFGTLKVLLSDYSTLRQEFTQYIMCLHTPACDISHIKTIIQWNKLWTKGRGSSG